MGETLSSVADTLMVRRVSLGIMGAGGVMGVGFASRQATVALCSSVNVLPPMSPVAIAGGEIAAVANTGAVAVLTPVPETIGTFLHHTHKLESVMSSVAAGNIPPAMYQGVRWVGTPVEQMEVIQQASCLLQKRTAIVLQSALERGGSSVEMQKSIQALRLRLQEVRRVVERVHHTALDNRMELLEKLDPTFCREESLAWQEERAQRAFEEIMYSF